MPITVRKKRIPYGDKEIYNNYMRNFQRTRKLTILMNEIEMLIANLNQLNLQHIIDNDEYTNLKNIVSKYHYTAEDLEISSDEYKSDSKSLRDFKNKLVRNMCKKDLVQQQQEKKE